MSATTSTTAENTSDTTRLSNDDSKRIRQLSEVVTNYQRTVERHIATVNGHMDRVDARLEALESFRHANDGVDLDSSQAVEQSLSKSAIVAPPARSKSMPLKSSAATIKRRLSAKDELFNEISYKDASAKARAVSAPIGQQEASSTNIQQILRVPTVAGPSRASKDADSKVADAAIAKTSAVPPPINQADSITLSKTTTKIVRQVQKQDMKGMKVIREEATTKKRPIVQSSPDVEDADKPPVKKKARFARGWEYHEDQEKAEREVQSRINAENMRAKVDAGNMTSSRTRSQAPNSRNSDC